MIVNQNCANAFKCKFAFDYRCQIFLSFILYALILSMWIQIQATNCLGSLRIYNRITEYNYRLVDVSGRSRE